MKDEPMTPNDVAAYSARYILEEFREAGEEGILALAKCTGYPEGVIAEALNNIFPNHPSGERFRERSMVSNSSATLCQLHGHRYTEGVCLVCGEQ